MSHFHRTALTLLLVTSLGACSAADRVADPADAAPATAVNSDANTSWTSGASQETEHAPKPFILNESPMPEGFPPPGPVGEIVVKQYPAYRAAFAEQPDDPSQASRGSQNSLFRVLFNHIKSNDIAMTAPVEMTYDPTNDYAMESMAFMYRAANLGPTGEDGRVNVMDVPAQKVLSLGLRGSYNQKRFMQGIERLEAWLEENAETYSSAGPPRYLGYNSPFVPAPMRFGEVQIPITQKP